MCVLLISCSFISFYIYENDPDSIDEKMVFNIGWIASGLAISILGIHLSYILGGELSSMCGCSKKKKPKELGSKSKKSSSALDHSSNKAVAVKPKPLKKKVLKEPDRTLDSIDLSSLGKSQTQIKDDHTISQVYQFDSDDSLGA